MCGPGAQIDDDAVDRQARDLPLDAHLHTDLSPDSDVPDRRLRRGRRRARIAEIAITDHVDFEPRRPAFRLRPFEDRERAVREAAERWATRGVAIRFGVEITYDRRWDADIRDHLARHTYDFVIGSVHVFARLALSPLPGLRVVGGRERCPRSSSRTSARSRRPPGRACSTPSATLTSSSASSTRTSCGRARRSPRALRADPAGPGRIGTALEVNTSWPPPGSPRDVPLGGHRGVVPRAGRTRRDRRLRCAPAGLIRIWLGRGYAPRPRRRV